MSAENAGVTGAFYLDTSVLRSIGRGLASLGHLQLRTSALAIVELVSAASSSEAEFKRIRPGFEIVTSESMVSIDWSLPEHYQATSFDWILANCKTKEQRLESLKTIVSLLRSAVSFDDFLAKEGAASLRFPLDYWREYDFLFGKTYIEASQTSGQMVKDAFDRTSRGEGTVGPVGEAARSMSYADFCSWFAREQAALNRAATIHGLAVAHARSIGMDPADDRVGAIHDSYNGSIDAFVDGFSWRAITDHSRGRTPGRNDALDLAHMLYLTSDVVLVTGDKAMSETGTAAGVTVASREALMAAVAEKR